MELPPVPVCIGGFPSNQEDMLQVHCDGAHFMPRLLVGSYEPIGKMLRGKKVYKKAVDCFRQNFRFFIFSVASPIFFGWCLYN